MVQLVAAPVGGHVHQHPDAHGAWRPSMSSSRAQISGTSPSPSSRAAVAGNMRVDVVGGGEQDADDVVVVDVVAIEHLLQQRDHALARSARSSSSSTVVAPRRARTAAGMAADAYRRAVARPVARRVGPAPVVADAGDRSLERPDLVGGQRPPRARRSVRSVSGPIRVRTSRMHGWPTASHIRRTWRLRPSWIMMRTHARRQQRRPAPARSTPSSSSTPSRSRRSAPRRGLALDLGQVLLLDAEARVGQPVGQLAVVGQQQQALGVEVEAADREHPRLGRHEVDHGRPALRVVAVVTTPGRLVQQVVARARARIRPRRRRPRRVGVDVDPAAEHGDLAVDRDPTVRDQLLADPPAAEPGGRQDLLEPFAVVRRRPRGSVRSIVGRSSRALDASRSEIDSRPTRRSPPSTSSTRPCVGRHRRRRVGVDRRRPMLERLDHVGARARTRRAAAGRRASRGRAARGTRAVVPNRTAWPGPGVAGDLVDVAALLERAHHAVDVDAADRRHLGPRDRLLVGDDGERLERGRRQAGGLALEHETLDVGGQVGVALEPVAAGDLAPARSRGRSASYSAASSAQSRLDRSGDTSSSWASRCGSTGSSATMRMASMRAPRLGRSIVDVHRQPVVRVDGGEVSPTSPVGRRRAR